MKSFLLSTLGMLAALVLTVTSVAAQEGYRVRSGDTLSIEVLQDPSLNRDVLVTPDGRFTFPFAGSIQASGRTIGQISASLAQGIASNFATTPNVFVSVRQLRPRVQGPSTPVSEETITVYLMGEVGNTGAQDLPPGTTFLQALSTTSLTNFAAERRIQVRRTDPVTLEETVMTINYRALQRGARMSQNIVLIEGDVILVPQRRLFE